MYEEHVEDSSRKDNNNDKETLLNRLLNRTTTIKNYVIASFYVGKDDLPIYFKFMEIVKKMFKQSSFCLKSAKHTLA